MNDMCKFFSEFYKLKCRCSDMPYFAKNDYSSDFCDEEYNCSQEGSVCFDCIKEYWRREKGEKWLKNTCKKCGNRLKCITGEMI